MIDDLQSLCTAALRSLPDVVAAAAAQAKAAAAEADPEEETNAAGVLEAATAPVAAASDVPIFVQAVDTFLDFLGMKEAPCRRVEATHTLVVIYDHLNPEQQQRVRDDVIPLLLDMLHSTNEPAKAKAEAAVLEIVYGDNAVHRNFVLSGIAQGLMGDDPLVKLNRTKDMDWILSAGPTHPNPPAQHVLDAVVIPTLISFLQRDAECDLQCEAARVLGNMAGSNDDQVNAVVNAGVIPGFVRLLSAPNNCTKVQSALGLANISARSPRHWELVVQHEAMPPLLGLLRVRDTDLAVRRAATRALAELYRRKHVPDLDLPLEDVLFDEVIPLIVEDLRQSDDVEFQLVLTDALANVAAHDEACVNAVVNAGAIPAFVPLLNSPNQGVTVEAASGLAIITSISRNDRDSVLREGALPPLLELLRHWEANRAVLPYAISALSNLFYWQPRPNLSPPVRQLLHIEVVPKLVSFLEKDDDPRLQHQVVLALKHIARGDAELTNAVADEGAILFLVELLRSADKDVATQSASLLAEIAYSNLNYRDEALRNGAMPALIALTSHGGSDLKLLRSATWAVSVLCYGEPRPTYESIEPALLAIPRLITHRDEGILEHVCWTLSNLTGGTDGLIQEVIDTKVCPRLVELLGHRSEAVQEPVIQTIGHILKGSKLQSKVILALNPLSSIRELHGSGDPDIRELSCQCISSLVLDDQERVQKIIDYKILPSLAQLVRDDEYEVQKEAAVAIRNISEYGSVEQIDSLVKAECIPPLCAVLTLDASKSELTTASLKCLENILYAGWEISQRVGRAGAVSGPRVNAMALRIFNATGLSKLLRLRQHSDDAIRRRACNLLELYYGIGEDIDAGNDETGTSGESRNGSGIEPPRLRRRLA